MDELMAQLGKRVIAAIVAVRLLLQPADLVLHAARGDDPRERRRRRLSGGERADRLRHTLQP